MRREMTVPHHRSHAAAAVGALLYFGERERSNVHEGLRVFNPFPHKID
jgi:hypothetical protein